MMRINRCWVLCLLLAFGWGSSVSQAQSSYAGIDIVFVVDQSGSMSGTGLSDQLPTDPQGLRFEAVQYALDSLVAYRQSIAPDVDMRMAVVAFGDNSLEILDWVDISRFDDDVLWNEQRDDLINQLSAEFFTSILPSGEANLGNTNFLAGYQAAAAAFTRVGTSSSNRLGVVVTITDGEPCVDQIPYQNICGNLVAQENYMRDVLDYGEITFPASNYDLYTIVLDASGSLWQVWQDEWTAIVRTPRRALRVDTSQQFGVAFLDILREIVAKVGAGGEDSLPPQVLTPGLNTVFIPPYQRLARISVFKSTSSPGLLTIEQPDGTLLVADSPDVSVTNQDRPIEIWVISNPTPGNWQFTVGSSDDRIDVRLELIPTEVQVTVSPDQVQQYDLVTVRLSVLSDSGEPLPSYPPPFDVLSVVSQSIAPDGSTQTLPLNPLIPGVYEGEILAAQAGLYQVGFRADVDDGTGTPFVIYETQNAGSFSVIGLNLQVDGLPTQAEYLVNNTLALTMMVVDESGNPLTLAGQRVEVALIQGGTRIPVTSEATETGGYQADILLDTAGTYTIEVLATASDAEGQVFEIGQVASPTFNVLPSRPVILRVLQPQNESSDYARDGLFFEKQPFQVEFETRLMDDESLIDIFEIAADPNTILAITLRDGEGQSVAENLAVQGTDGEYTLDLGTLDSGDYTLTLELVGDLSERYVVPPSSQQVQVRFSRGINYLYGGAWAGIGVLGLLVVAGGGMQIRRGFMRRQHPARGTLIFNHLEAFGDDPRQIKNLSLDRYNSNYIVLGKGVLPKETGLTKLIIECSDENMSERKRVRITAFRGKEEVVRGRVLAPGQSVTITDRERRGESFQIVKEADEKGGYF